MTPIDLAIEAAFKEMERQQAQQKPDDLSESKGLPPYSLVLAYDGFNLRKVIEVAVAALNR